MKIQKNINLAPYNTFQVSCLAKEFVILNSLTSLTSLTSLNPFFLGGGANTLFVKPKLDRLVIKNELKGKKVLKEDQTSVTIEAASGEDWIEFVNWATQNNWSGIEKLALIPGTVGGAVTGNIGAYGQTISEVVESVSGYPPTNPNSLTTLKTVDCQFSYRESIFKKTPNFFVTSAVFKFSKFPNSLASPKSARRRGGGGPNSPQFLATQTTSLRQAKLPDWKKYPTAGSFFKNPLVSKKKLNELLKEFPDLPSFPSSPSDPSINKIPAGFLLDKLGWRGKKIGRVGTWPQHALIVINYGRATGQEILDYSQKMQADVKKNFDIDLEPEVNIIL